MQRRWASDKRQTICDEAMTLSLTELSTKSAPSVDKRHQGTKVRNLRSLLLHLKVETCRMTETIKLKFMT